MTKFPGSCQGKTVGTIIEIWRQDLQLKDTKDQAADSKIFHAAIDGRESNFMVK